MKKKRTKLLLLTISCALVLAGFLAIQQPGTIASLCKDSTEQMCDEKIKSISPDAALVKRLFQKLIGSTKIY